MVAKGVTRLLVCGLLAAVSSLGCGSSSSVGESGSGCTDAPLPTATTDCKIAGTYQIQVAPRCPNTCSVESRSFGPVVVTTDGVTATARFEGRTSGGTLTAFQLSCKLTGCDCKEGASQFVFTADGLVGDSPAATAGDAGMCTYRERLTATRQ